VKGIRFYAEYRDTGKTQPCGTVVAIETEYHSVQNLGDRWGLVYDGYGAVFSRPNSPVATTGVALDYLRDYCKRVTESEARETHPRLFEFLDEDHAARVLEAVDGSLYGAKPSQVKGGTGESGNTARRR
jgi:hypothetical protein